MEENQQQASEVKQENINIGNKKSNVSVWGIIALVAIILILIFAMLNLLKPISKFKKDIDVATKEELIEMYNNIESVEDKSKANELVKEKVSSIIYEYAKGSIEYEEAISNIEKYQYFSARYNYGKTEINELKKSKESFQKASDEEKNSNYVVASELYSKVIEKDLANYEEAKRRLIDCEDVLKSEYLNVIQVAIANENYVKVIEEAEAALKVLEGNSELIKIQEEYKKTYKTNVIKSVEDFINNEKFVEADMELETALKVLKNDKDLMAKRNEIATIVEKIKTTVNLGDTITDENNYEISFISSTFTTRVNPSRPDSYYSYYAVKDSANNKYLVLKTKIKNLGANTLDGDSLPRGTVVYDNKYTYDTFRVTEEDDGSDLEGYSWYQDIEPLKTKKIWYLVELPNEVVNTTDNPIVVDFVINDVTYHVNIR